MFLPTKMSSKYLDGAGKPSIADSLSPLAADLCRGIDVGEMQVVYQSIVSNTGAILGAEAMLQWQHSQYGLLLPGSFREALDEPAAAEKVSHFLLDRVCRDLGELPAHQRRGIYVTLSMPLQLLLDSEMPGHVDRLCTCNGISPRMLVLGLLENEDFTALSSLNVLLNPIRRLGVRLALDDFGHGLSSLARLESVLFDVVKLSGRLIQNVPALPRSCGLVAGLIALLHNLPVKVVVQGVEHSSQALWLNKYPDIALQGLHFRRRMTSLSVALAAVALVPNR